MLAATVQSSDGKTEVLHARKILLATGQDGMGLWWMPPLIAGLPAALRAHCADEIDFASLRNKVVAVVGAGASALDNAAMALEHGAREVLVLCRRDTVQVVQPIRWLTFRGFLAHLGDLDDVWRWRFMSRVLGLREGFPQETYDRCARHAGFRIVTGAPLTMPRVRDSRVEIGTPQHVRRRLRHLRHRLDIDFAGRPELRGFASNIATWADRYTPPASERKIARSLPLFAPDFSLVERSRAPPRCATSTSSRSPRP